MVNTSVFIHKPVRDDARFGPEMTEEALSRLLSLEFFQDLDPARLDMLRDLLRRDARLVRYKRGDIVLREGDYGNTAYLILNGNVCAVLDGLDPVLLGRRKKQRKSFFQAVAQLWRNPREPEVRDLAKYEGVHGVGARTGAEGQARIFLQDVPGVLQTHRTAVMGPGEIFGEQAALARTPRSATVIATADAEMLEVRWQGLRDLRARAPRLREYVDKVYRERVLAHLLQGVPIFRHLGDQDLLRLRDAIEFETYGGFDWFVGYEALAREDTVKRLAKEPIIAEEGHYPNGLLLIRSGFARLSVKSGNGHRTISYLGKGQLYGLEELAHNWRHPDRAVPLLRTLRAVGYVDILKVPTPIVEEFVLKRMKPEDLPAEIEEKDLDRPADDAPPIPTGMLEFLVDQRFMNGTATMVIDLDRCTRCDMCVVACAGTHEGNPRFLRNGPKYDHYMIANACMHCADPVCMIGCPTGAIHRQPGGQVIINDATCIGCSTCATNCPYHAIRMVPIRDDEGRPVADEKTHAAILKATKCDLCSDQIGGPACQRACPHDALVRTDMANLPAFSRWLDR